MSSAFGENSDKFPKAAAFHQTAFAAQHHFPMSQCLQEALNDVVTEDQVDELEDRIGGENTDKSNIQVSEKMRLSQEMASHVMKEYAEAMARSTQQGQGSDTEDPDNSKAFPPAGMLGARVDHYNKSYQKWRIVVHEAKFKDRVPLDKNRKKRGRPSLWNVAGEQSKRRSTTLQILAYDDL